jgi:hypothetical protein
MEHGEEVKVRWSDKEFSAIMKRGAGHQIYWKNYSAAHIERCRVYEGILGSLPITLRYTEGGNLGEEWQATITFMCTDNYVWGSSAQECVDGLQKMIERIAEAANKLLNLDNEE